MGWYGRQNTFKRTLANPYFQTKSGSGGGSSALAPGIRATDKSWRPADYAAIGGLLGLMGNKDSSASNDNLWTVTPEGQWALKSEEVQSPEEVLKLPQQEQQQYFRQMIYGDPREASLNQWNGLPDFMAANGSIW